MINIIEKTNLPTPLNYTRPVIFENEDESYQYSICGSAFGIKYRDRYFVITAKHVSEQFDENTSEISIFYEFGSERFLPLKEYICIKDHNKFDDFYQFDIIIYEVCKENLDEDFNEGTCYHLSDVKVYIEYFKEGRIIGFPHKLNTIEYEKKIIKMQRFDTEVYIKKDSKYANVIHIQHNKDAKTYLQGMSGSPVFGKKIFMKKEYYYLLGMFILTDYFISINHIREVIKEGFFKT